MATFWQPTLATRFSAAHSTHSESLKTRAETGSATLFQGSRFPSHGDNTDHGLREDSTSAKASAGQLHFTGATFEQITLSPTKRAAPGVDLAARVGLAVTLEADRERLA